MHIFLDGAGNLNATGVVFFFMYAEEATGVPILSKRHCEPGKGKTALDCNFAHQKGHADIVNRTGVDSVNAAQFRDALDMHGGVAGNTNMVIKYDRDYQPKIETASGQLAGLSRCLMMEFIKSASGERCVRLFENARIGQGRVITESAMWPLLAKPGSVAESELKAMLQGLIGELPVYQLPPQATSNPQPKMMLSDSTRDQKKVEAAEKKKSREAKRAEERAQEAAFAEERDSTFHCSHCDTSFLTARWRDRHQAGCAGKRIIHKQNMSGKAALTHLNSAGRLDAAVHPDAATAVYAALTVQSPSTVGMFARCDVGRLPCRVLRMGYARNTGREKVVRFDDDQKEWMRAQYRKGLTKKGRKVSAEAAESDMKTCFPRDKWLTAGQIRGFYQQYKKQLKKEEQARLQDELAEVYQDTVTVGVAKIQAKKSDVNVASTEPAAKKRKTAAVSATKKRKAASGSADKHTAKKKKKAGASSNAQVAANVLTQHAQRFVGRAVKKAWGADMYDGKVMSYDPKKKWFKIVYCDSDWEELNFNQLEHVLVPE
jgi:hypothetical protein